MATITTPVTVTGSDIYTIGSDDILDVSGDDAITWTGTGTSVSITNNGIITDSADQSLTADEDTTGTLIFTNSIGALVDVEMKFEDLGAGATVTINNSGMMTGRSSNALELSTAGATFVVNNYATGIMTQDDASKDIIKDASNTTVNNYGRIISSADELDASGEPVEFEGDGIDFGEGTNNVVNNHAGGRIESSRHAITGDFGITIVNEAGALIAARNGAGINFDNDAQLANIVTVTNRGTILGQSAGYADSDGDAIDTDGLVDLDNYGFIGGMGASGEHEGGPNHSEALAVGGGTINNYALGVIYSVDRAIQVDDSAEGDAPGATAIFNAGVIQGAGGEAIKIVGLQNDSLTNKGTIIGDIMMGGGNDTVTLKAGSNILGDILLGAGNDIFKGSAGAEDIYGGGGFDTMTGGAGADTFFFASGDTSAKKAGADLILDFNGKAGDDIDLEAFDANTLKNGNQAFKFIEDDAFHNKAGELRAIRQGDQTLIQGDVNGDGKADFAILLDDPIVAKTDYFIL